MIKPIRVILVILAASAYGCASQQVPRRSSAHLIVSGVDLAQQIDAHQTSISVLVVGGVNRPGKYTMAPGGSLADLVALAGGLTRFHINRAFVNRTESESGLTLDFSKEADSYALWTRFALRDHDVITFPEEQL